MHIGNYTPHPLINGLSDHDGQILQLTNLSLNISTQPNETKIIHNFCKHNIHNFKTNLRYEIWDTVFGKHDVNEIFNNFHNTFLRIFHSIFPEKKIQIQNKDKTWITKGIQTSIKNKKELYLKCRNSSNHKLKIYYKSYCKLLTKIIRQAKTLHYSNQILKSDNKSRTLWNIVKSQTGKKIIKDEVSILDTNGAIIHNKQKIANSFNDYFSTIAENLLQPYHAGSRMKQTNLTLKRDLPNNIRKPYPNIKYKYTSTQEIEKIIKSLKSKNAHGYDGVSTRILKWSAPYISSPLTYIFNKALEKGVYPIRLKYSTTVPIYKTGDRLNMSNFRPISLLISFSKILEKIIYNRINAHINLYKILVDEQYGFRENTSTDNAAYMLLLEIITALNNKQILGGIFATFARLLIALIMKFYCVNWSFME